MPIGAESGTIPTNRQHRLALIDRESYFYLFSFCYVRVDAR